MLRWILLWIVFFAFIQLDNIHAEETRGRVVFLSAGGISGEKRGAETVELYDRMTAVIIGIDRYRDLADDKQLKYAVHDAKGVAEVLREHYPFHRIITLYNEEATRDRIMKVLQGDLSQTGVEDAVLIYFAGHGITRPTAQGDLGYLIAHDGSLKPDEMYKNISMQQLKADVCPLIPAKHILIITDACFGGLLLATRSGSVDVAHQTGYLREITKEHVRQIITAGGKDEPVLDGGADGHSVFTGRLIEALRGVQGFMTGKELGFKIQRQVYGDAAARGHKQRPLVGEIYGTGDFVFVPSPVKRRVKAEDEVKRLERELSELELLKKSASKRKEDARLREIEREKLLKEAALKQARLREEAARHEAELKAKAEEEARKDARVMELRKKEREERLVYLKTQAEKLRKKLGSPARALGLDEAIKELSRINDAISKLEKDFAGEIELQLRPLNDYYGPKIAQAGKVVPRDRMFETEADYNTRLNKQEKESASLKAELAAREKQVRDQVHAELSAQRNPLLIQQSQITDQDFSLGAGEVSFRFLTYNPELEEFKVYIDSGQKREKDTTFVADLPVPKESARGFFHNPDLLVPEMALGLREDGSIFLGNAVFHGSEDARYEARNIRHGHMEEVTFKLMSYNSEKEEFRVYIEGKQEVKKGMSFVVDLTIPRYKADEFFRDPSLLTPEAVVGREKDSSYTLRHAVFRGPGGEICEV